MNLRRDRRWRRRRRERRDGQFRIGAARIQPDEQVTLIGCSGSELLAVGFGCGLDKRIDLVDV